MWLWIVLVLGLSLLALSKALVLEKSPNALGDALDDLCEVFVGHEEEVP